MAIVVCRQEGHGAVASGRRVATWRSRSADGTWEQVGENRSQLGLRLVSAWKERPAAARTAAGRG